MPTDNEPCDKPTTKPTVAIVGSGAVGAYFGARIWESDAFDVKFLMRGEHYEASVSKGLQVTSVHGDIFIPPEKVQALKDTKDMGKVDWVIVALKSTSLQDIPALIFPLLEPGRTNVLVAMNGFVEEDIIHALKVHAGESTDDENLHCCKALYGGLAYICSNKLGPARIDHSDAGTLSSGLAARCVTTTDEECKLAYENLWKPTKVNVTYEHSLRRGRWRKNCWNLPFNGISVVMGGMTTDKIMQDPGLRQLAIHVIDDVVRVANADLDRLGLDSSHHLGENDIKPMLAFTATMGPYRTSTTIDFEEKRPMEVKYLFRKPIEIAHEIGVPVPHLETLVLQIEALQRLYNLF